MKDSKTLLLCCCSYAAALCMTAASAFAQPVLTSLGAVPGGISNPQGGTYYISASNGRWSLNGATLTFANIGAADGGLSGLISADGAYQTCTIANNGAVAGNTAGTQPPFSIPTATAPFALPAANQIAARYTASGATIAGLPGFANDAINNGQQVFGSGDNGRVFAPQGISHNGRFIVGWGYVSTYNTLSTSPGITSINGSGGVATVTTPQAHLLAVGNQVIIQGNLVSAFNGTQTVLSVPDATHFTFSTSTTGTGAAGQMFFDIGTRITATSAPIHIRGGVWDATTNTMRALPTPMRTSSQTGRRRDGAAYAVSDDGTVIVGAQEPFSGTTPFSDDPDGPRLVVYRWNGSSYVMSYLPNGLDISGFPATKYAISGGNVCMNGAGTIITGPAIDNAGNPYVAKWVWNAGTSSWNAPINLGYAVNPGITITSISPSGVTTSAPHGLAVNDWVYIAGSSSTNNDGWKQVAIVGSPTNFSFLGMTSGTGGRANKGASWLPYAVLSTISQPSNPTSNAPTPYVTGMSDDGNTVVGYAQYPSNNSVLNGGWIWTAASGFIADWYDYLHGLGVAGVAPNGIYGPIGDLGDMTLGQPQIGNPTAISPDGSAIVGTVSGITTITNPLSWALRPSTAPACVGPAIAVSPSNQTYSRCTGTGVVTKVTLTTAAGGTLPITYQWYKGGTPLSDGSTGAGSTISGATTSQIQITSPVPADNGQYHCVVTGCNGTSAVSADATVQNDPNAPSLGDTCATAIACGEGAQNFNICGCYVNDSFASCAHTTEVADVWFRYTPTFTGNARFQTCGTGTMDTTLEVLSGCNGAVLACNDDAPVRGIVGIVCPTYLSIIYSLPVAAGVPVLVRVGVIPISPNLYPTGVLTISQAPNPPANDLCTNPTPVTLGTYPFDLSEATEDFTFGTDFCNSDPAQSLNVSNRDIWYRLISPFGGTYTISTCGSTVSNTMLHVMTSCDQSSVLACNDNVGNGVTGCGFAQSLITNLSVSGSVLIRVAVGGAGKPSSGLGQLVITGTNNPGCGSADFNCDGDIGTDADIEAFFRCLAGTCPPLPCLSTPDFNGDGDIGTDADIEAFFRVLAGGSC